jgi:tetratricopeptide (TPR) repeat protein
MQVGDYAESERTLRVAIRNLEVTKRWRLHLTLSRLLVGMGDNTDINEFYEEALSEVKKAIKIRPDHTDPYFHAGIVQFKLKDYLKAKKSFDSCLKRDKNNFEAERNIRIINPLIYIEIIRSNTTGRAILLLTSLLLLLILWGNYFYFKWTNASDTLLITTTTLCLGVIVIAFLLPSLARLQLPGGFVAELSQLKETISSGPTGEIGFSTSLGSGSETGLPDSLQIGKGPT